MRSSKCSGLSPILNRREAPWPKLNPNGERRTQNDLRSPRPKRQALIFDRRKHHRTHPPGVILVDPRIAQERRRRPAVTLIVHSVIRQGFYAPALADMKIGIFIPTGYV